jgi:hypothetical protein
MIGSPVRPGCRAVVSATLLATRHFERVDGGLDMLDGDLYRLTSDLLAAVSTSELDGPPLQFL